MWVQQVFKKKIFFWWVGGLIADRLCAERTYKQTAFTHEFHQCWRREFFPD